jgi:hypothetical protein
MDMPMTHPRAYHTMTVSSTRKQGGAAVGTRKGTSQRHSTQPTANIAKSTAAMDMPMTHPRAYHTMTVSSTRSTRGGGHDQYAR